MVVKTGPVVGDLCIPMGLQYLRSTNHQHEHVAEGSSDCTICGNYALTTGNIGA